MFRAQTEMKIFSGSAHRQLAQRICAYMGVPLGDATVTSFPDGETFVKINENIRGRDVFIVQPTCPPTNQNLMELLIMVDAARRASAARITAVIPFFGYARQDRKDQPRVPITAKLVANLLTAAGVESRADDGSARAAGRRVLRHPGGSPLRRAGDHPLSASEEFRRSRGRLAGRRRLEDGVGLFAGARAPAWPSWPSAGRARPRSRR